MTRAGGHATGMDERDTPLPDDEREPPNDDELHGAPDLDRLPDGNFVGEDNIRQGRVGGVMGGTHQQGGEGQGG